MANLSTQNNSLVMSYLDLRKAVGIIGLALPFVLVLGKLILAGPGLPTSISGYYYTVMRDVFVASLCSIGVFLISYRGYERMDEVAGKLATIFAVGTAFLPTSPVNATGQQLIIGRFHAFFAASLFLTLAFFALILFRKTKPNQTPTPQKQKRNLVYTISGLGIIACVLVIFVIQLLPLDSVIRTWNPVFWLESLAIVFFGISWFVKGEAILKDDISQ